MNQGKCPSCEGPNACACAVEKNPSTCWCFTADVSEPLSERYQEFPRCLCADCIKRYKNGDNQQLSCKA